MSERESQGDSGIRKDCGEGNRKSEVLTLDCSGNWGGFKDISKGPGDSVCFCFLISMVSICNFIFKMF